jgi:queuine tRNA-ribosyltransferase/7-cyano-7-deazaguanine tRNA-ribosyltransferase
LGAAKKHGIGKVASGEGNRNQKANARPFVSLDDEGVDFYSHFDGSRRRFTPESVIHIQRKLGADIMLVLDECTSPQHDYEYTKTSVERTHRWAVRSLDAFRNNEYQRDQALWGIVQGGQYRDLREKSAAFLAQLPFDGYSLGGALGSNKDDVRNVLAWTTPLLPWGKPKHLLGMGEVEDIFAGVVHGVDLFDCIVPTLLARTGTLLVKRQPRFRIHIRNTRFQEDSRPAEDRCSCPTCAAYSRAYLRHLFLAQEPLGVHLAAVHNVFFIESLMTEIRQAIRAQRFDALRMEWMKEGSG